MTERQPSITELARDLEGVVKENLRLGRTLEAELLRNAEARQMAQMTLENIASRVVDMQAAIRGDVHNKGLETLMQELQINFVDLAGRIRSLENYKQKTIETAEHANKVASERMWSLLSGLAPWLILGALILIYSVMRRVAPQLLEP